MIDHNESFEPGLEKINGIKLGQFSEVYLSSNEEWVVKKISNIADEIQADWLDYGQTTPPPVITWERFMQSVNKDSQLLQQTQSGLKDFIPPFNLVWGQNDGNPTGYVVMKRVSGHEITEIEDWTDDQTKSLEDFLIACLNFYEETKKNSPEHIGYFPDIVESSLAKGNELKNIMLGKVSNHGNELQDSIYYIDTYPLFPIIDDESLFFRELQLALKKFEEKSHKKMSEELWEILTTFYGPRNRASSVFSQIDEKAA